MKSLWRILSPFKPSPVSRGRLAQLGLLIGGLSALFVLLLWAGGFFNQTRLRTNDAYYVPLATSDQIVIVAIDDASLSEYGRSMLEWPRSLYADAISTISGAGARVIAFDILFAEPSPEDDQVREAIAAARASDARTRIIMPVVGAQRTAQRETTEQQRLYFEENLAPVFAQDVDYLGYVNAFADSDGAIRRQLSLIEEPDNVTRFSLDIAAYLAYLRIPAAATSQLVQSEPGRLVLTPERSIHVDGNGLWMPYFFGAPGTSFTVYSFADVLDGDITPRAFADKIVLIGVMNSTGSTDVYPVPSSGGSRQMAGVEIHAHTLESLLQNVSLREQSSASQAVMIALLALVSGLVYPQLRWYWTLAVVPLAIFGWVVFALVQFPARLELVNLFHSVLAIGLPAILNLTVETVIEVSRRQRAEFLLDTVVAVSNQRLALDRILPTIANDLRRILRIPNVAVWAWDESIQFFIAETVLKSLEPNNQTLVQARDRVRESYSAAAVGDVIAVPVLWQGRLLGVFAVEQASRQKRREAEELLTALAARIAPSLDNAMLYSTTERQKVVLETVLTESPASILLLDYGLGLVTANETAEDWLNLHDDWRGLPFASVLREAGVEPDKVKRLLEPFSKRERFRVELKIGEKTYTLDAAPVGGGEWQLALNDVSSLVELSQLKTRMIRMASHDLKNPLSRVLAYGTMIQDDVADTMLPTQGRKFVGHMVKAGEEMQNIINDILTLEQLRSGTMPVEPMSLEPLIDNVLERHKVDLQEHQQKLVTVYADNLPPVLGNPRQLAQAVTNLIGNAIKYTPNGGTITLRLVDAGEFVRFSVQDTGYGISREAQAKLFQEFYRVRTQATAHIHGTGLGLSLVKSVIDAHNGRIWVESEEGVGSVFSFELPVANHAFDTTADDSSL